MKKSVLCLLSTLVLLFGLFTTDTFAEGTISDKLRESFMKIDLDYLIAYRDTINEIIAERGGEVNTESIGDTNNGVPQIQGEPFSEGVYEVGKTIKPGIYRFDLTDMRVGAMVYVYDNREKYEANKNREHYITSNKTASYTITLEEGNILSIALVSGSGNITISNAKASWMP